MYVITACSCSILTLNQHTQQQATTLTGVLLDAGRLRPAGSEAAGVLLEHALVSDRAECGSAGGGTGQHADGDALALVLTPVRRVARLLDT